MTIFWKIFLGFWTATIILILFVFADAEILPSQLLEGSTPRVRSTAVNLRQAADAYEAHGPRGFAQVIDQTPYLGRTVVLFDVNGEALTPGNIAPAAWQQLVAAALKDRSSEVARFEAKIALASPIQSSSGHQYVVVMSVQKPIYPRLLRPAFWTKVAYALVPETIICFGLALLITRPLSHLSQTTRRLAEGDLSARPGASQKKGRDEIGQLSRDFDIMADRIQGLLSAQRRFVADVAHELGAPLTRLQLALSLLYRDLPSERNATILPIERETERLSQLVQELLFLANLESGPIPTASFTSISLADLCREVVRDNALEAEEKGFQVTARLEEATVDAAPQILRRAVENVLRNAIRHSSGATSVVITCKRDQQVSRAVIEVEDTGPGLPEDMVKKIFEPFVRVVRQGSRTEGTGLGLAIARDAVLFHGGTISAANSSSGGLVIRIELPLAP